jgi:hypothetical protein
VDLKNSSEAIPLLEKYLRLLCYQEVFHDASSNTNLHHELQQAGQVAHALSVLFLRHLGRAESFEQVNLENFVGLCRDFRDPWVRDTIAYILSLGADFVLGTMTMLQSRRELCWSMVSVATGFQGDQEFLSALQDVERQVRAVRRRKNQLSFVEQRFASFFEEHLLVQKLASGRQLLADCILETVLVASMIEGEFDAQRVLFERLLREDE